MQPNAPPTTQVSSLTYHLLAWGAVLLFAFTFSGQAIQRYHAFESEFDLGVYDQVVWNTLQGDLFFYTSTGQPLLHFSNHADPILLLVAPLYLIHSGPETLLILQATLIGLAGLPLFWLGRAKLKSDLAALCLLLAYLLFPGSQVVTLSDFHPPALAFAFLMFAFYFLEIARPVWFLTFAVLAMACKEQIPLQVIFLGLYALLWLRRRWLGLLTIGLGAGWFWAVMGWLIPAYSVTGDHLFLSYYAEFGESPLEILLTVISRPDRVLQTLLQPARLAYLRHLFLPFGFLPLIGLPVLLIGAPSFGINLLSANPAMHDATRGHYIADVTPWLAWAALFGVYYLSLTIAKISRPRPRFVRLATPLIGLALLATAAVWHIDHGFSPLAPHRPRWTPDTHDQIGEQLVSRIPPTAPISAQVQLYAHLSHRHIAYVFPVIREAEYILLDVTSDTTPFHPNNFRAEVTDLLAGGEFGLLEANDGYLLLKRGLNTGSILPDEFYNFARVFQPNPQYPLEVTFGEQMRLLGYDLLDDPRRGETQIRLYWQALRRIDTDLQLYPFFIDLNGDLIEDTRLRPMATQLWYPPRLWQPGETIVSQTLPWPLGERWSLAVGVLAGDDWADWSQRLKAEIGPDQPGLRRFETNTWVRLATFQRRERTLTAVTPSDDDLEPSLPLQANFADQMQLLGYDLSQTGETIELTLYWETLQQMGLDYTIFVHLVDGAGNPVAQQDAQPWWEVPIPTSTWQPGEILKDHHSLPLPPELPAAPYTLHVGVYFWQTLERLPVLEAGVPLDNFVVLGEVELAR